MIRRDCLEHFRASISEKSTWNVLFQACLTGYQPIICIYSIKIWVSCFPRIFLSNFLNIILTIHQPNIYTLSLVVNARNRLFSLDKKILLLLNTYLLLQNHPVRHGRPCDIRLFSNKWQQKWKKRKMFAPLAALCDLLYERHMINV